MYVRITFSIVDVNNKICRAMKATLCIVITAAWLADSGRLSDVTAMCSQLVCHINSAQSPSEAHPPHRPESESVSQLRLLHQ